MELTSDTCASQASAVIVSVVITCYNQACWVAEAIQSVLDQTYNNIQLIVVDDGSLDNSAEVIARYEGLTFIRQKNSGVSSARNAGLRKSNGQFIVFLDADDRLKPFAVEMGVRTLRHQSQAAFVFGWCELIDDEGQLLPVERYPGLGDDHYLNLLRSNFIWMPATVMFRREVLIESGAFAIDADQCSDFEIYLRLARQFPIYSHGCIVSEWRQHSHNTSQNFALMLRQVQFVLKSQTPFIRGNPCHEEARKAGLNHYSILYGDQIPLVLARHLRNRLFKRLLKDFIVMLCYYPKGVVIHTVRKVSSVVRNSKRKKSRA